MDAHTLDTFMTLSCSVCASEVHAPSVAYGAIPLCDAYDADRSTAAAVHTYGIDVVTCHTCGHSELKVKPPEEAIYANYKYFSSNSPDLAAHFSSYADWLNRRLALGPGMVHFDIGCNDGLFLEISKSRGLRTAGIDPSPAAARASAKGLDVSQAYLTNRVVGERKWENMADVVTCNNVVANVRGLIEFGKCAAQILKPGGFLVFETLHYPLLLRKLVFEMINHEHYHYFSVSSMRRYFERLGLDLVSCEHVATKGANMRCVAQKSVGRSGRPQANIDSKLADAELPLALATFERALEDARATLRAHIEASRRRGPIAGFGSSAGTTILLYLMGVENQIDYLVDDSPARHGFFSPGSAIPVVSSAEYYRSRPSLTVVFAWRFAEAIAQKHRGQLPADHAFILANTGRPA